MFPVQALEGFHIVVRYSIWQRGGAKLELSEVRQGHGGIPQELLVLLRLSLHWVLGCCPAYRSPSLCAVLLTAYWRGLES